MPPSSPPSEHNVNESYSELTNQDVEILHQIIVSAQQSPNFEKLPFRAVFAAYDAVLAQNHLDPDHDQIYLRFLFKLGDKRRPGQTLYEAFEALLEQFGIRLEFDDRNDGIQEVTRSLGPDLSAEGSIIAQSAIGSGSIGPSRRASFTSMYDVGNQNTRASGRRAESRASDSQLQTRYMSVAQDRPSTRATTRPTEKIHLQPLSQGSKDAQPRRGRLKNQGSDSNLQRFQRNSQSGSSKDPRYAFSPKPLSPGGSQAFVAGSRNGSSPFMPARVPDEDKFLVGATRETQHPFVVDSHELLYRPSDTQLLRDAHTFHHFRIRSVADNAIKKWVLAAVRARRDHYDMEMLAIEHDTKILCRQAFDHWRSRLVAKVQALETERFFERLELRAGKARDLHLLTKAFTHWAQCAQDEVLYTSNARRHILNTKYFNAWREITAVNNLKVRRQVLRKFFGIWKGNYVRSLSGDVKAISVYHENLARTVYWRWFWAFCERRAPEWRAGKLKSRHLAQWVITLRQNLRRKDYSRQYHAEKSKREVFKPWLERTRIILSDSRQATLYQQRSLATQCTSAWRLWLRHAPIARQISNMVDWRVACETFGILVARHRVEKQAEDLNRLRIVRNAWTHWNDRLRWETLANQINDRVLLEALYRWVLAERVMLLRRLHDQRLKQRCFAILVGCSTTMQRQRANNLAVTETNRNRRSASSIIRCWKYKMQLQRQHKEMALEFQAPRIAHEALDLWRTRYVHSQKLAGWARDADFFFLATRTLKRWKAAIVEAKRQKRRDAYIQIRRRTKMALARSVIRRWRDASIQILSMQQKAYDLDLGRCLDFGSTLFDHWRSRSEFTRVRHYETENIYEGEIARKWMQTWKGRASHHWQMEEQARLNSDGHVANLASGLLRKLRLRILEVRGRERGRNEIAESFKQWNKRRHLQRVLRHWHLQTASRLGQINVDVSPSSKGRRLGLAADAGDQDGLTQRAEDWTAFDEGFDIGEWMPAQEAQSNTTPLPGYLNTPSKRAARARALVQASTTPATPVGTPLQRRLWSQMRTTRRGEIGRASVGFLGRGGIGDVAEESPRTPGV